MFLELPDAVQVAGDVSDEQSNKAAVSEANTRFDRLNCVVNSAGYYEFGDLETTSLVEWDYRFAVHATGTVLVCCAWRLFLRDVGRGTIVNIVSAAALVARARNAAYSTAKGAVLALSHQLALDPAPARIRVNSLAPRRILTTISVDSYTALGNVNSQRNM